MQNRMENLVERKRKYLRPVCLLIGLAGLVASGCGLGYEASSQGSPRQAPIQPAQLDSTLTRNAPEPCAVALASQTAGDPIDRKISRLQEEARRTADPAPVLERLGWLFVSKARTTHDPGYFKLAEQVAVCMGSRDEKMPSALLLRGHVLHNLHRFKEAESVARELLILRQAPFDYGLLGDVLMEQGRLEQAAEAYQKMVDLKPGLHSYSRVAHLRWLKGDFAGAIPVMRMAARASSPRDAESAAWVYTRLALLELQAGDFKEALRATSVCSLFRRR